MTDRKIIMPLEEIMGDRFGKYSKYIIQDRALPDVRDGLKPVQRRILYAMYKEGNVHSKPYRKCAKTVGVVIGNYHPHGDTSVYDAMVRLSQEWKMRVPLVDIQGNNGSIDNDPPAAMRYTEARLSKIAVELLRDIDKDTVNMALNFDDTEYEPTVLPAKFPNLLVNGATGISAGYATDIPPHNFQEVIDATIYRIQHPNCSLESLMEIIKGPDFPTGAIVEGRQGLIDAFSSGRGRVVVRSKVEIEKQKQMNCIVITEIPYEVNKAELVRRIDEIRFNRSIDGIIEVRDESDRNGLRIVVDLKKEVPAHNVLNYLYKNTDLQKNYNYNMVAIKDKRPVQMGLIEILDAYIAHQVEVVTRRSVYELDKANSRKHIVDGLIKAISILDEVVATIRKSKDKTDAKNNLMQAYAFSEKQAEAIVMLQLYRLTNTDIVSLEEEYASLEAYIASLTKLLNDGKVLRREIIKDLKQVRALYPTTRLTEIRDEIAEISIDKEAMIISEDIYVSLTMDGYLKRISPRSFKASEKSTFGKKDDDVLLTVFACNTLDKLLIFTDMGNYLYVPVHEIEEFKWRDLGKHISYLVKLASDEKMVGVFVVRQFRSDLDIVLATEQGQVKRTSLIDYEVSRYTKAYKCINLKENDRLCAVSLMQADDALCFITREGFCNLYAGALLTSQGLKAGGVKGIALKGDDRLVSMHCFQPSKGQSIMLVGEYGGLKRIRTSDIPVTNRAVKGISVYKKTKTSPQFLIKSLFIQDDDPIIIGISDGSEEVITGSNYHDSHLDARLLPGLKLTDGRQVSYVLDGKASFASNLPAKQSNPIKEEPTFTKISFDDLLS